MQPFSFQYQPPNLRKEYNRTPNFLSSKNLDKSAPNIIPNRYNSSNLQKEPQNANKTAFIASTTDVSNGNHTPKGLMEKNNGLNNFSSSALKHYHNPQLNRNQEKPDRPNRGQMSKSLVIQQSETNGGSVYTQANKKSDPAKYSPPRRAPRMSQGYQPYENNFLQNSTGTAKDQDLSPFQIQKQTNFMKVKKFGEDSREKKPNFPSFLSRNAIAMKRSSLQFYVSQGSQKTIKTTSTSSFLSDIKPRRKVVSSDFEKIKELGNGKYGRVYLVRQKSSKFICALKVIQKKLILQEQITEQFIRELKIQIFLNHPNIIKMYGYFDDEKNIYIILQVGTGGQLYHQLKKSQSLPQAKVAFLMKQICDAVNQIHSLRIIHRDIKPQNIVLHDNIIKLCDFGWSVHQDNKLRTTFCGTPLYVCPQILRGKQYDQKIDIWSLGIMMYQMVVGQNPFKITKQEQLIKIVKDQIKIPSYVFVSSEARDFLDKCLQKNPADRVTIRQLVNHPFLKKYQEKDKKSFNL